MLRGSLALLLISLVTAVHADEVTSFHYLDLYHIQQSVADMRDLQALRVDVYVTSTLPGVRPQDITLTLHRATGALQPLQHDDYGHTLLPVSDALKAENPLIVTNQPKHSLNASVVIDLVPPPSDELPYTALMLGVSQLNDAIAHLKLGALAKLYDHPATGLLLFYNYGNHSVTLHGTKGDEVVKSVSPDKAAAHLKGFDTRLLIPGMQVIYLPLDAATLKQNPGVTLDTPPTQIFPAF
jgi:hypothetical protein